MAGALWGITLLLSQLSAATIASPEPAKAEEQAESAPCEAKVGEVIGPVDAESAAALNADVKPKSEFETDAQYMARLDRGGYLLPVTLFVSVPIDRRYVTYDPEAASFDISESAIDNMNLPWESLPRSALPWISDSVSANYIDIVVKWHETSTGSYRASNAYGASTTVRQISRRTIGILERPAQGRETLFSLDHTLGTQTIIAQIPVDAAKAPAWRSNLRAAVLIEPKPPFVVNGIKHWEPIFDRPEEVTEKITAIVADIRCVVLTNERNVVLAAIPTR